MVAGLSIEQDQEKSGGWGGGPSGLQQIWLSISFTLKSKFLSMACNSLSLAGGGVGAQHPHTLLQGPH